MDASQRHVVVEETFWLGGVAHARTSELSVVAGLTPKRNPKLQTSSPNLQGNFKLQAPNRVCLEILPAAASRRWHLVVGARRLVLLLSLELGAWRFTTATPAECVLGRKRLSRAASA